jgi:hypothetical protein
MEEIDEDLLLEYAEDEFGERPDGGIEDADELDADDNADDDSDPRRRRAKRYRPFDLAHLASGATFRRVSH